MKEQARLLYPVTKRFFREAGIARGMRVLDVGSGVGYKSGMKPRHAAALALVGWYLLIPPKLAVDQKVRVIAGAAPFSRWQIIKSFDTEKECREAVRALVKPIHGKCVPTDDPRLKGK